MQQENCFSRTFPMLETVAESLAPVNRFLEENGYARINPAEFRDTLKYEQSPVSFAAHGYEETFILTILRDPFAHSQFDFVTRELVEFRDARDWQQFHNSKDLASAISIEAAELNELFLWKSDKDADPEKLKQELADIFSFSILLAEKYKLNIEEIILEKIRINAEKYPIEKSKGTAKKYNEL